jgi:hypothetical protein
MTRRHSGAAANSKCFAERARQATAGRATRRGGLRRIFFSTHMANIDIALLPRCRCYRFRAGRNAPALP